MTAVLSIDALNAMDREAFTAALGHAYESTPALAATVWDQRPFAGADALTAAFAAAADALDDDAELALLRAHPQLAAAGPMTTDSQDEQRGAGLRDLDPATHERIRTANAAYLERFGFPFIIAVRGLGPAAIADALDERLGHDADQERATALAQVKRIAALRIAQVVGP